MDRPLRPPSAPARPTPLTPAEISALMRVASGLSAKEAAVELGVKVLTVHAHMRTAGNKLYAASAPTKVHNAYLNGQLPAPEPVEPPEGLTDEDRQLIRAVATCALMPDVAEAAGLLPGEVSARLKDLMSRTGARSHPHLVHLGFAYRILHPASEPGPGTA
ncbi:hypothetical protein GCM10010232_48870 [Streptomyces amakusaensis]|uniref:LuxR C-terminal-related transcriptional regulator n=1 Tax=Streptomyces amakusaensis TaxID=67271 RepID=A0ABW0AK46_9ACTN